MANPFGQFLNDEPEAAYFSYGDQWRTPNMKKFFQSQFTNIQNQYMGALGSQVRQGGAPTQQFTDFLGQYDWQRQANEQGVGRQDTSRYSPFARWMT